VVLWYIKKINQMKRNYEEKEFVAKLRSDLEKHFDVLPSEKLIHNERTQTGMRADLICFIREGTPEIAGHFFTVECKPAFGKKVRSISDAFHQASEHVHEGEYLGKRALFGLVASPESYDRIEDPKVKYFLRIITQHEALRNIGWLDMKTGNPLMMMSKIENKKPLFSVNSGFDLEQLSEKQGSKRVRTYGNESV